MKKQRFSARDRRIVRKRFQGKTIREIAREEGIWPNSVTLILKRVQPELKEALRLNSHDLYKTVRDMVELTQARKTLYFAHRGIVRDEREVADNAIRLAARREMLRVHGVGLKEPDEGKTPPGVHASDSVISLVGLDPQIVAEIIGRKREGLESRTAA